MSRTYRTLSLSLHPALVDELDRRGLRSNITAARAAAEIVQRSLVMDGCNADAASSERRSGVSITTAALARQAIIGGTRIRDLLDVELIAHAADLMRDAVLAGKKVLLCGNGGSAADAQHIAAELVGRFVIDRSPLPAIALTTDTSTLTAIANDFGYEHVFARQILALGSPGDVLVAITTSGTSKNVVSAVAAAQTKGMKVIALTGVMGGDLVAKCDAGVMVPSTNTARIQECHITIGHIFCEVMDAAFHQQFTAASCISTRKQMELEAAVAWRDMARSRKQLVVWTNGMFDVLHAGHLKLLRAARAFGDLLIVGVNADAAVTTAKGRGRPIYSVDDRVEMLAALEVVDAVVVFDEATPERVLSAIRPDVHVKGGDYSNKPIPERGVVEKHGGRVEIVPSMPGRSSTDAIARITKTERMEFLRAEVGTLESLMGGVSGVLERASFEYLLAEVRKEIADIETATT